MLSRLFNEAVVSFKDLCSFQSFRCDDVIMFLSDSGSIKMYTFVTSVTTILYVQISKISEVN